MNAIKANTFTLASFIYLVICPLSIRPNNTLESSLKLIPGFWDCFIYQLILGKKIFLWKGGCPLKKSTFFLQNVKNIYQILLKPFSVMYIFCVTPFLRAGSNEEKINFFCHSCSTFYICWSRGGILKGEKTLELRV